MESSSSFLPLKVSSATNQFSVSFWQVPSYKHPVSIALPRLLGSTALGTHSSLVAKPNTREDLWESFWSSSWGLCRASQDTWNFTSCLHLGTPCNPQILVTKCTYTVSVNRDKTQNDLENISRPYPIKQNDSVFSGNIMALVWHYQTIRVFQSNSDGHITLQFTEVYFILPLFFMLSFFLSSWCIPPSVPVPDTLLLLLITRQLGAS